MYRNKSVTRLGILLLRQRLCWADKGGGNVHTTWSPTFDLPDVVWSDVVSFLEEILKICFGLIVIFNFPS